MAWNDIPIDPGEDQQFNITVEVGEENVSLILHLSYNTEGDFWRMDVSSADTEEMLISGVSLLTSEFPAADILEQFEYIGIGQAIVLKMTDDAEGDFPNLENIDTDYVLFWGKEEEG